MNETAIFDDFELRRKGKGKGQSQGKKFSEVREELPAEAESVPERNSEKCAEAEESRVALESAEIKVRVLRVCANPRLVECVYSEGALERRVLVRVNRNMNFRRGMELEARRPANETEVWGYAGALPRFAGRW